MDGGRREGWRSDRRIGKIFIWVGVFLGLHLLYPHTPLGWYVTTALAAVTILVWGFTLYVKSKGHHWAWGFLSLIPIIGWVSLVAFPDRHPTYAQEHEPGKATNSLDELGTSI